jgi:hypothetical protein
LYHPILGDHSQIQHDPAMVLQKKTQHFQLSAQELRNRHKRKRKPASFHPLSVGALGPGMGALLGSGPRGAFDFQKRRELWFCKTASML